MAAPERVLDACAHIDRCPRLWKSKQMRERRFCELLTSFEDLDALIVEREGHLPIPDTRRRLANKAFWLFGW
jgi:hypothetical protein